MKYIEICDRCLSFHRTLWTSKYSISLANSTCIYSYIVRERFNDIRTNLSSM